MYLDYAFQRLSRPEIVRLLKHCERKLVRYIQSPPALPPGNSEQAPGQPAPAGAPWSPCGGPFTPSVFAKNPLDFPLALELSIGQPTTVFLFALELRQCLLLTFPFSLGKLPWFRVLSLQSFVAAEEAVDLSFLLLVLLGPLIVAGVHAPLVKLIQPPL